jgi:hypothetical protein
MTTISLDQWKRMGQGSFDERLIGIIRRNHPEQAGRLAFPELVGAIHRQAARAATYGLNDERSVATYVYTAWLLGEEFDQRIPAIAQILTEKTMPSIDKAEALGNFTKLVFHQLDGATAAQGVTQ